MAWGIDKIEIENFKFFKEKFDLLVDCKNILLYGENGSGKSSIYWSFYTIFQACLKTSTDAQKYFLHAHPENLRNRFSNESDYSGIKVTFRNAGTRLTFEDSNNVVSVSDTLHDNFMKLSMASSDFMNYKFLASIFDFSNSQDNDIFNALTKEVFPFLSFKDSLILDDGTDSTRNDADFWWKYLSNPQEHVPTRNDAPNGAYIITSLKYKQYVEKLRIFNDNLKRELTFIFKDANVKLKELFNENISLHFTYKEATFNERIGASKAHDGKLHRPQVILYAKMTGDAIRDTSIIKHPRSFFNEARLTCMALALRLAFMDARVIAGDDFASAIFIDDLLISLDMSCRKLVISLLLKYADSKQMFIFTHDRAFFEMTWSEIQKLGKENDWNRFDLYVFNQGLDYDKPILMGKKSYIDIARQKYNALDLPGCANTIRSACERELKRVLPLNFVLKKQLSQEDSIQFNNLGTLINQLSNFRKFFFDSNLDPFPDIAPNLSHGRKLVMNPYSHDDIETPLYRRELECAIEEVEKLSLISKKRIITDEEVGNKEFTLKISTTTKSVIATFIFVERFERVEYESVRYYGSSKIFVKSISDTSIHPNTQNYTIRNLYKDVYEHLGFTACMRPSFENCIFAGVVPLSSL